MRLVYFNAALVCVLVVAAELIGQLVYVSVRGYPLWQSEMRIAMRYATFEPHPYLVGRLQRNIRMEVNDKAITTTDTHTRWTGAPSADPQSVIRIAVLGGSTAFGTLVTDADSWPALLQQELGSAYAVTNYAVPGYSSAEAIIQMALIVPESQPHVVIFYGGWNDIRNYHVDNLGPDYFAHGMQQFSNLGIPRRSDRESLLSRLSSVSFIFRSADVTARMLPARPSADVTSYRTPDPFVDRIYLRNLGTLKLLASEAGASILFVPQLLNHAHFSGKTTSSVWSPHIEDDAMPALLERFNGFMNQACPREEPGCLVLDEIAREPWPPGDFADEGHFSRAGGEKFSGVLAPVIREMTSSLRR